jgi:hypothetical protein
VCADADGDGDGDAECMERSDFEVVRVWMRRWLRLHLQRMEKEEEEIGWFV